MPNLTAAPHRRGFLRRYAKTIAAITIVGILVLAALLTILAHHAEPLLRARVIETLTTRFQSRVDLDTLNVSVYQGLLVSGKGLRIYGHTDPNIHQEGIQPLIEVDEFRFRASILSLLKTPMHVALVDLKGLAINIPPKGDRQELSSMGPKDGKIKVVVDQFRSQQAQLIINTNRPDKQPLEFDIQDLRMRDIGAGQPLSFEAILVNPKPVGNINSQGEFGPFNSEEPRDSPVRGEYTFSHADLGTLKGISGILSSTGSYEGTLGKISVDGRTDTPDFRLKTGGHPVPLKTTFHAIVDGTSGNTYLQPVNAMLLNTPISARGFVVKSTNPKGHHIQLDATIPKGRIEDVLKMAVHTDPPVMTGELHLRTRIDISPGEPELSDRLYLKGNFEVSGAHFSNDKIQGKVDALSMRSQGKPKLATDNIPDNVMSSMGGNFELKQSVLSLPDLVFEMPGTKVSLAGQYSLDGNQFDFQGKARFDAKVSQMVGGWKSILLKPVDPFFSKHGAGTEVPIAISGTRSEPHFGINLFGNKRPTQ